ncbi:Uncharacterised protein [Shigella sonnei]|nr:Uncharacterised protein [Shigella sonnei]CSP68341.1 Uncharacterised protein [Shigella sonnei]CSQ01054.1 Uncharacterised protein [Shigella sonnei]CSQ59404.1 Uncharacterised protein [Shigella sonnei]CSQ66484.1 Uncharacterised protein [Shigella sonnei]
MRRKRLIQPTKTHKFKVLQEKVGLISVAHQAISGLFSDENAEVKILRRFGRELLLRNCRYSRNVKSWHRKHTNEIFQWHFLPV